MWPPRIWPHLMPVRKNIHRFFFFFSRNKEYSTSLFFFCSLHGEDFPPGTQTNILTMKLFYCFVSFLWNVRIFVTIKIINHANARLYYNYIIQQQQQTMWVGPALHASQTPRSLFFPGRSRKEPMIVGGGHESWHYYLPPSLNLPVRMDCDTCMHCVSDTCFVVLKLKINLLCQPLEMNLGKVVGRSSCICMATSKGSPWLLSGFGRLSFTHFFGFVQILQSNTQPPQTYIYN